MTPRTTTTSRPGLFLCVMAILAVPAARAQTVPIVLDEDFSDWEEVAPNFDSPTQSTYPFQSIRVANDPEHLFISFEIADEALLQNSTIALHIDLDADASTGVTLHDIGVDLHWWFGERTGILRQNGSDFQFNHSAIGLVVAPTVSGRRFELALRLGADVLPAPLVGGSTIRLFLEDNATGRTAPEGGTGIVYTIQEGERKRLPVSLERAGDAHFRLATFNILSDGPSRGRDLATGRLLQALRPDIIAFQEMYTTSAEFVVDWLNRDVPLDSEAGWHAARAGNDLVLASRYPIVEAEPVPHNPSFPPRTGFFLVDLGPDVPTEIAVYISHPSCCNNEIPRQEQIDAMMAHLRHRQSELPHGTPFLLVGDFNLVGLEEQRSTILYGDIRDNETFGPDFSPDWDGTSIADLRPRVAGAPMTFTWHDTNSDFSPGRLDYIFYSDYALEARNGLVLFTLALTNDELVAFGLDSFDSSTASDHLPVVGDFRVVETSTHAPRVPRAGEELNLSIHPNPTSERVSIRLSGGEGGTWTVHIVDVLGREVHRTSAASTDDAPLSFDLDVSSLAPGVYLVRASDQQRQRVKSLVVMR